MRPLFFSHCRGPWLRTPVLFRICGASNLSYRRYATSQTGPLRLDFQVIDKKWQKRWEEHTNLGSTSQDATKAYILAMFPYPSGALHMGHLRVYTINDVLARFKQMQGYNVLYPMGWDAFGLPAENAAIERGVDPAEWTIQNVTKMKDQLKAMNSGMDWSREFMTCDPEFYKHTQHIFLLLLEAGLAYQAEALVNYDPVDRTVLANEQVDSNGYSWRSGAKVEQINLKQWFLKTTAYRDALLDDLDLLVQDGRWPEHVVSMQKNWLGKSKGATLRFSVQSISAGTQEPVEVFTTRADTLFGVQYLAVSASHPLVKAQRANNPDLEVFLETLPTLPSDSKVGFRLPNVTARNPLSSLPGAQGHVLEPLPIYVTPYVLEGYGSGAVMGVPGHDTRDNAFWKFNRPNDPIIHVVQDGDLAALEQDQAITSPGTLSSQCGEYRGLTSANAAGKIINDLQSHNEYASNTETWKLRDWLISRQRYWGTPIPVIHCDACGTVPVPHKDLPVELPKIEGSWMKHRSGNPLEFAEDWVNVPCPSCKALARRDTDTMDTFACSSWYMFRFIDPRNKDEPVSVAKANSTMPVDVYIGGVEHAILHLLYARFISKFLADAGIWPDGLKNDVRGEPFRRLVSQGMVHGKTYSDPQNGRFLKPEEVDTTDPAQPRIHKTGESPNVSFEKMSKSKYNGVDPTHFIAKYGADVTRSHILFQAPVSEVLEWEEERIVGIQRWFNRIWRLTEDLSTAMPSSLGPAHLLDESTLSKDSADLVLKLRQTINLINEALSTTFSLNTCISNLMELTNTLSSAQPSNVALEVRYHVMNNLVRMLAPFAPAFSAEVWERLHTSCSDPGGDVFAHGFPEPVDESKLKRDVQTCAIMENGKLRLAVDIDRPEEGLSSDALQMWVLSQVKATEQGKSWLESRKEKKWKRIVVVKGGKTVNFVG